MLPLKLIAIAITTGAGLLQIMLQPAPPKSRSRIQAWLVALMIIGAVVAAALIILDDRQSAIQIKTLTDLKQSADSAASAATAQEEEAKMGRTELKQEIAKLQSRLDPFLSLATIRYPLEGPENALERLTQDIKELKQQSEQLNARTQQLAERESFRPLEVNIRQQVVSNLRRISGQLKIRNIRVLVSVESGHSGRQGVAKELIDILQEGGAQVFSPLPSVFISNGGLPAVIIELNAVDEDVGRALAETLNPFIKTVFTGNTKTAFKAGTVDIQFRGEPLFDENGVVTFR